MREALGSAKRSLTGDPAPLYSRQEILKALLVTPSESEERVRARSTLAAQTWAPNLSTGGVQDFLIGLGLGGGLDDD